MVAVYCVFARNVGPLGDQLTAPVVKLPLPQADVLGALPVSGLMTIIAALVIGLSTVAGNWSDSVTVVPVLFVTVADIPFIVAELSCANVCPGFAVSVTVAVYTVLARNAGLLGDQLTAPMV